MRRSARRRISERRDSGTDVDERRAEREHGAQEQADGNGDLEPRVFLGEEDLGRPDGMEAQEAAGRHERQREQEDAGIAAPVRGLARRVPEEERRLRPRSRRPRSGAGSSRCEGRAASEAEARRARPAAARRRRARRQRQLPRAPGAGLRRATGPASARRGSRHGCRRFPSASSDVERAGSTRIVAASDSSRPYGAAGRSVLSRSTLLRVTGSDDPRYSTCFICNESLDHSKVRPPIAWLDDPEVDGHTNIWFVAWHIPPSISTPSSSTRASQRASLYGCALSYRAFVSA